MKLGDLGHIIHTSSVSIVSLCRAAFAGITGAFFMLNEMKKSARHKVDAIRQLGRKEPEKKSSEVITMKKSTVVALFTALAVVAGVLGALYVYVLRREKELDEYEQLLFSEDFDDDDDITPEELDEILGDVASDEE